MTAVGDARKRLSKPVYFIAPDAWNDPTVWRTTDSQPVAVISRYHFRHDTALWDVLATAIVREGVS
jgi:hypothetical protein